jgi:phosphatidylglycerophosphatase A
MPGTFGSIFAAVIYYFLGGSQLYLILSLLIITLLGFLVSSLAEKIFSKKDAPYIVIDEMAGMLLSFLFLPFSPKLILIGFLLFRILDTLKPYPAARIQELKGSLGIMGDDFIAGLYTNFILQLILRFTSFKIS